MTGVLITGFEAWGKVRVNPSGELARAFDGVVLPTEYRASVRVLLRAVRERRPRALLMLGLAANRKAVSVERLAVNADHAKGPDNAGEVRIARTIDRRGPPALESRLPVARMVAALKRARIPAEQSFHAGTYCCNHLFYVALRRLRIPCGFVHVPTFRSLPEERQRKAVGILAGMLG